MSSAIKPARQMQNWTEMFLLTKDSKIVISVNLTFLYTVLINEEPHLPAVWFRSGNKVEMAFFTITWSTFLFWAALIMWVDCFPIIITRVSQRSTHSVHFECVGPRLIFQREISFGAQTFAWHPITKNSNDNTEFFCLSISHWVWHCWVNSIDNIWSWCGEKSKSSNIFLIFNFFFLVVCIVL